MLGAEEFRNFQIIVISEPEITVSIGLSIKPGRIIHYAVRFCLSLYGLLMDNFFIAVEITVKMIVFCRFGFTVPVDLDYNLTDFGQACFVLSNRCSVDKV